MAVYTNINRNTKNKKIKPRRTGNKRQTGIVLLSFAILGTAALFTNFLPFLRYFLMGLFGIFSYAIFSSLFIFARSLMVGKKLSFNKKYTLHLVLALLCFLSILQMAFLGAGASGTFFVYLSNVYHHQTSIGGVIIGIITYPVMAVLNPIGAYVFFIILLAIFGALIIDFLANQNTFKKFSGRTMVSLKDLREKKSEEQKKGFSNKQTKLEPYKKEPNLSFDSASTSGNQSTRQLRDLQDFRNRSFEQLEEEEERSSTFVRQAPKPVFDSSDASQKRPPRIIHSDYSESFSTSKYATKNPQDEEKKQRNLQFLHATISGQKAKPTQILGTNVKNPNEAYSTQAFEQKINERLHNTQVNDEGIDDVDSKFEQDLKALENKPTKQSATLEIDPIIPNFSSSRRPIFTEDSDPVIRTRQARPVMNGFEQVELKHTKEAASQEKPRYKKPDRYNRPPIELLTTASSSLEDDDDEYLEKSHQLEQVLNDFRIPAKVIAVTKGPAVTRYELQMPVGVSVKKISQHAEDIAMTLASNGAVRIEAPIPGKNAVGVEVPNKTIATIGLKDILDSREFVKNKSPLTFGLGKDISGNIKICDLAKMPHLLVAGATGSGKSVCLNALIVSMLYKASPDELRLILIDPKRVEFYVYNGLPHLMLPNVITEADKAINALGWAVEEMERRFNIFQDTGVKNLTEYNMLDEIAMGQKAKMPIIVIVVDELADLMLTNKREVEEKILRLAGKARAAGIHLVIATQRPSVDVITGTIKANLTSRIAFSLTSFADSKTILDGSGAEKLLGKGDMLYAPIDYPEPRRIQGAFVSNEEVRSIVEYVKQNNKAYFDEEASQIINQKLPMGQSGLIPSADNEMDPLMPQALKLVIESGQASISMIQRRFSVGYARAARIIDQMELLKYISPSDGSKARNVYITMEKYQKMFGG